MRRTRPLLHAKHALYLGAAITAAATTGGSLSAGACAAHSQQAAAGAGGSGEGGGLFEDAGVGGEGIDAACALYEIQGVQKPVNLYIMFDKSSSMVGTRWDSAKAGLGAFVNDPTTTDVRVALRFFPRTPDAVPACDQMAYKEPTVPYGALPAAGADIMAAMDGEQPDGFDTPIYPALGGAILKGIDVATAAPTEASAVLLVTDGVPQGPAPICAGVNPEDPGVIADLAATGAGYDPPVSTYVVGLPGVDQSFANLVAAAGGTDSAILVSADDIEAQFQQALLLVSGDALPCSYEIPEQVTSGELSLEQVNIEVTPGNGDDPYVIPRNDDCDGPGWRYDDPDQPTAILLCAASCQALKSDKQAFIRVVLGCASIIR